MSRTRTFLLVVAAVAIMVSGCFGGDAAPTETAADPAGVSEDAITAIDSVETYRVQANETVTVQGNLVRTIESDQTVVVNRSGRRLHAAITQSLLGNTIETDVYLLDGRLYQRSSQFVSQYSTEWLTGNLSGNYSEVWATQEPLARHALVLNTTAIRANGTTTVAGEPAVRLEVAPDPENLEQHMARQAGVSGATLQEVGIELVSATYTVWVSTERDLPLAVNGTTEAEITANGQTRTVSRTFRYVYEYETAVSIDLPDGAETARSYSEVFNGTRGGG